MIYCIVGKARSGKSYITELLLRSTGYPVIEVSSLVKEFAGQNASRKELQLEKDKHINNPDWLYDKIAQKIKDHPYCSDCIVSGIREVHLLDKLKRDFGPILIYAAIIPDGERWQRIIDIDKKSKAEIFDDDKRDTDLGVDDIIYKRAHYHINTNNVAPPTEWKKLDIIRRMSRIQELQIMFDDFERKQYSGINRQNSEDMALGIAEEVGELCHHILKRKQGLGNKEDHDAGIKDALADIAVFSLQLASFENIDWEDNFINVSDEVLKRVRTKIDERYKLSKGKR